MRKGGWIWIVAGGGVASVAYLLLRPKAAAAAGTTSDTAGSDGQAPAYPGQGASPSVPPAEAPAQPSPPPLARPPERPQPAPRRPAPPRPAPKPAAGDGPAFAEMDERTALARVIRSEAGSHTAAEQRAVAWVVRNRAKKRGMSIARLVCYPTCGPQGKARPFSSRVAPRAAELALAAEVLAQHPAEDPTGGAWDAFEPALQDQLVREGRPGYRKTAAEVRRDWTRHSDFYGRVGHWELFGPKGGARAQQVPTTGQARRPGRSPAAPPARRPQMKYVQERLPDKRPLPTKGQV
ncbi:MAG: hypothetical protein IT370_21000 [Deltaproteobacteria bacterium]|nr:hypothetical protein [Deltaproteobacteria bacterium]